MGNKKNFISIFVFMLLSAITSFHIFFVGDSSLMASAVVIGLSAFLGIESGALLQKTITKPSGEYCNIKHWRYIFGTIIILPIYAMSILFEYIETANIMGSGIVLALSIYIGTLSANKTVTNKTKKEL